jgi:hypothetical protein
MVMGRMAVPFRRYKPIQTGCATEGSVTVDHKRSNIATSPIVPASTNVHCATATTNQSWSKFGTRRMMENLAGLDSRLRGNGGWKLRATNCASFIQGGSAG